MAHSGWKGTVKRIGQKTIEKMKRDYGSCAEDILTAIGPSIQECHFEVGDEVAEIFIKEFGEDTAVNYCFLTERQTEKEEISVHLLS